MLYWPPILKYRQPYKIALCLYKGLIDLAQRHGTDCLSSTHINPDDLWTLIIVLNVSYKQPAEHIRFTTTVMWGVEDDNPMAGGYISADSYLICMVYLSYNTRHGPCTGVAGLPPHFLISNKLLNKMFC